jgi:hypothetical protein
MKQQLVRKFIPPIFLIYLSILFITSCQKPVDVPVKSQIIYTDINPDSILYEGDYQVNHYDFDFDKNGIEDYTLVVTSGTSGNYFCKVIWNACEFDTYNEDSVAVNSVDSFFTPLNFPLKDPLAINQNDVIDGSITWQHDAITNPYADLGLFLAYYKPVIFCSHGEFSGTWKNITDKFLGLKLKLNGLSYYGWICLTIGVNAKSMIVKGYAYNSIPNQAILAGQIE